MLDCSWNYTNTSSWYRLSNRVGDTDQYCLKITGIVILINILKKNKKCWMLLNTKPGWKFPDMCKQNSK